jgi:mono/diheme cytochrome c family protein
MSFVLVSTSLLAGAPDARNEAQPVTPVSGESWLNHLQRSFGDTSMGKTGRLGPPPGDSETQPARWQLGLLAPSGESTTMRGQDLFRLNCQSCHGEAGQGAPPEIRSVIDPVRGTVASLIVARMKQRGMEISSATAGEMAKEAQGALWKRLHEGGQDMPPFPQLNDTERLALLEYLKQLAKVPGAKQATVNVSSLKIGEMIVKSTCHICHDATGVNPPPGQMELGAIPPLETLTTRTDELEFIRKVTIGAPVMMGTPASLHRGRMPVFYYLTREEAADTYRYLSSYPPSQFGAATPTAVASQQNDARSNSSLNHSPAPRPGKAKDSGQHHDLAMQ